MSNETLTPEKSNPTLAEAFKVWWRIGLLSFGGPAAQIALIHREVVEGKRWLSEKQYLNALSFCMLLPGPEAMQLVTYAGWRLHGTIGGLIAGLCFVLPGAVVIALLATVFALFGDISWVDSLFLGIKAAVIVIVIEALLRVSKKALSKTEHWFIAGLAFIGIFFFVIPFPIIIGLAAAFGFFRAKNQPDTQSTGAASRKLDTLWQDSLIRIALWLAIWWIPILLIIVINPDSLLADIGIFFSKLAVVTFGGAYAVLAYLGQDVVTNFGWLTAGEMMNGLGLAETTPGPLILVNEFVGFLAAFREQGLAFAFAGALVTLWATFVPCFLWIFAGAPYIEWIGSQAKLRSALTAITAAVVGVILNLSIWFALHVFFKDVTQEKIGLLQLWTPDISSIDLPVIVITGFCAITLLRLHWSITRVLGLAALLGLFSGQVLHL